MDFSTLKMRRIAVVVLGFLAVVQQCAADDAPLPKPSSAAEMLDLLRGMDPPLENYSLQFTRRETKHVNEFSEYFQYLYKTRGERRERLVREAPEFAEPYDATLVGNITITVRGKDLMFATTWLTDHHGHPQLPRSGKGGIVGDVHYDLAPAGAETFLEIKPVVPNHRASLDELRMFYELALGIGFGRRLKSIETMEQTPEGWNLTGTIQIWRDDKTTCELRLDHDYRIREAHLHANTNGNETDLDFTSSGTVHVSGRTFAQAGTFKRTHVASIVDGNRKVDNQVRHEWTIECGPIELDLSDERFKELTFVDRSSATHVFDSTRRN